MLTDLANSSGSGQRIANSTVPTAVGKGRTSNFGVCRNKTSRNVIGRLLTKHRGRKMGHKMQNTIFFFGAIIMAKDDWKNPLPL